MQTTANPFDRRYQPVDRLENLVESGFPIGLFDRRIQHDVADRQLRLLFSVPGGANSRFLDAFVRQQDIFELGGSNLVSRAFNMWKVAVRGCL